MVSIHVSSMSAGGEYERTRTSTFTHVNGHAWGLCCETYLPFEQNWWLTLSEISDIIKNSFLQDFAAIVTRCFIHNKG